MIPLSSYCHNYQRFEIHYFTVVLAVPRSILITLLLIFWPEGYQEPNNSWVLNPGQVPSEAWNGNLPILGTQVITHRAALSLILLSVSPLNHLYWCCYIYFTVWSRMKLYGHLFMFRWEVAIYINIGNLLTGLIC